MPPLSSQLSTLAGTTCHVPPCSVSWTPPHQKSHAAEKTLHGSAILIVLGLASGSWTQRTSFPIGPTVKVAYVPETAVATTGLTTFHFLTVHSVEQVAKSSSQLPISLVTQPTRRSDGRSLSRYKPFRIVQSVEDGMVEAKQRDQSHPSPSSILGSPVSHFVPLVVAARVTVRVGEVVLAEEVHSNFKAVEPSPSLQHPSEHPSCQPTCSSTPTLVAVHPCTHRVLIRWRSVINSKLELVPSPLSISTLLCEADNNRVDQRAESHQEEEVARSQVSVVMVHHHTQPTHHHHHPPHSQPHVNKTSTFAVPDTENRNQANSHSDMRVGVRSPTTKTVKPRSQGTSTVQRVSVVQMEAVHHRGATMPNRSPSVVRSCMEQAATTSSPPRLLV